MYGSEPSRIIKLSVLFALVLGLLWCVLRPWPGSGQVPVLCLRDLPPGLEKLECKLLQETSFIFVQGKFQNSSGHVLGPLWLQARYLDAKGQDLNQAKMLLAPSQLEPRAKAGFSLAVPQDARVARVEVFCALKDEAVER